MHPYLSSSDKQREDDSSHSDPKHSVNEEAAKETENHIWPGVPWIESHKSAFWYVQGFYHCVLEGSRIVIAEVAAYN